MVIMNYCDGASFSGHVAQPITYRSQKLYFRGRNILDATINQLYSTAGFSNAQNVILSGCSAGGLATYLHADYVSTLLPNTVQRYRAIPGSGFFLFHNTVQNLPVYQNQMQYVFKMQNVSQGINSDCVNSLPDSQQWLCFFCTILLRSYKNSNLLSELSLRFLAVEVHLYIVASPHKLICKWNAWRYT
jgi:hypothetical protein